MRIKPRKSWAISIHVLRVEDDTVQIGGDTAGLSFQSTSSVWRTTAVVHQRLILVDISIHVLRVEDDRRCNLLHSRAAISIHVLRVEDDCWTSL